MVDAGSEGEKKENEPIEDGRGRPIKPTRKQAQITISSSESDISLPNRHPEGFDYELEVGLWQDDTCPLGTPKISSKTTSPHKLPTGTKNTPKKSPTKGKQLLFTDEPKRASTSQPLSQQARKRKYEGSSLVSDEVDTVMKIVKKAARGEQTPPAELKLLKKALRAIFPFNFAEMGNISSSEDEAITSANASLTEAVKALTVMTEGRLAALEKARSHNERKLENLAKEQGRSEQNVQDTKSDWERRWNDLPKPSGQDESLKKLWEDVNKFLSEKIDTVNRLVVRNALTPFPWNSVKVEGITPANFITKTRLILPIPILEFLEGLEALTYKEEKTAPISKLVTNLITAKGNRGATIRNKALRSALRIGPLVGELTKLRQFPSLLSKTALTITLGPLAMWGTLIWAIGEQNASHSRYITKVNDLLAEFKERDNFTLGEMTELLDNILPPHLASMNWGHPEDPDFTDLPWYSSCPLPTELQVTNNAGNDDESRFGCLPAMEPPSRDSAPMPSGSARFNRSSAPSQNTLSPSRDDMYGQLRKAVTQEETSFINLAPMIFKKVKVKTVISEDSENSQEGSENSVEFDFEEGETSFDYNNQ